MVLLHSGSPMHGTGGGTIHSPSEHPWAQVVEVNFVPSELQEYSTSPSHSSVFGVHIISSYANVISELSPPP